jgi:hypothetical protein
MSLGATVRWRGHHIGQRSQQEGLRGDETSRNRPECGHHVHLMASRGIATPQQRVVGVSIHVHEASRIELLVPGELRVGLAGQCTRRIILAVGLTPLASGVIRQPLQHRAGLVGDHRDRARWSLWK